MEMHICMLITQKAPPIHWGVIEMLGQNSRSPHFAIHVHGEEQELRMVSVEATGTQFIFSHLKNPH